MRVRTILTLVLGAVFAMGGAAQAENYRTYRHHGWWPGGWYASTWQEGVLRGQADLWRAWGDYNLSTAQAMTEWEEARRANIDNREYYVQKYFEIKKANREARAELRNRPTAEEAARYSKAMAPERLAEHEYDVVTGKVYWPPLLLRDAFQAERAAIDEVMASRTTYNSGIGSQSYLQVRELAQAMERTLKVQIHEVSTAEYLLAKNFLRNLQFEVQFVPVVGGVAAG